MSLPATPSVAVEPCRVKPQQGDICAGLSEDGRSAFTPKEGLNNPSCYTNRNSILESNKIKETKPEQLE